ncbi:MAG: hypothetical protein WBV85_08035 [Solirubrobacteraceae bacterium]
MRKYHIAVVSSIAVLAFCVVGVASAVAAITIDTLLAEWLVGGVAVATSLNARAEGEVLIEDTKTPLGAATILCSGITDGTIGANGAAEVTSILTLSGVAAGTTPLVGESITCTSQKFCGEEALLWPVHLPWRGVLELVEELEGGVLVGSPFFAGVGSGTGGNAGYYLQCKTLGVTIDDECTAAQGAGEATNVATGVLGVAAESFTELMGDKLATCSLSKEETGVVEGSGVGTLETGTEILSVSSVG